MKSTIRKALALLAFLALAALLIPLGNTFLVQLDTFATLTMRDLRERDDVELAIVGSSIVQHHFNPALIAEATGLTAFDATITNMVIPASSTAPTAPSGSCWFWRRTPLTPSGPTRRRR